MFAIFNRWWRKPGDEVADLVATARKVGAIVEREACAKACEARVGSTAVACAAAIRRRAHTEA